MNGATALDCEKTISSPNSTNTTTIGTSQYFFSCFRNCTNSPSTRPLLIRPPAQLILSRAGDALEGHRQNRFDERVGNARVAGCGQMHAVETHRRIDQLDGVSEVHVAHTMIPAEFPLQHRAHLTLLLAVASAEHRADLVRLRGDDHHGAGLQ